MQFTAQQLKDWGVSRQVSRNRWVPARPLNLVPWYQRVKHAWLVITGKADIVVWPGEKDWE